jgi:hypothetical protein
VDKSAPLQLPLIALHNSIIPGGGTIDEPVVFVISIGVFYYLAIALTKKHIIK